MFIYDMARRVKSVIKDYKKQHDCEFLSPVRRIERTAPVAGRRICAMTFDDGPSDIETNPRISDDGLTLSLLKTLESFGARGTFDVIGTTEDNYPDVPGKHGSFSWGGMKYDHYPDIDKDLRGGAKNRPDLIARILEGGHEITNHGYRHILFGHPKLVYGARACFKNVHEVIDDIMTLQTLLHENHGYEMRLGRPPHYVDKIPDGKNSYDAYRYAGYQYLAASFDGGGWHPSCGDTKKDADAMVEPLKAALAKNADALNGQIIFQKDGFSMSRHTPVAEALPLQLQVLSDYGYEVVTVSELLAASPFTDVVCDDAAALANAGYTVAYRNNSLLPGRALTFGELVMMSAPPKEMLSAYRRLADNGFLTDTFDVSGVSKYGISPKHPYFLAYEHALSHGALKAGNPDGLRCKTPVTGELFKDYLLKIAPGYECGIKSGALTRADAFPHLRRALLTPDTEESDIK